MIRILVVIAFLITSTLHAATGFLEGERTSGLNKICFYDGVNGEFTKTIGAVELCPLSADDGRNSSYSNSSSGQSNSDMRQNQTSVTGFLKGESTSGFNKTCVYDSVRGSFTKTVSSTSICPLSAKDY